MVATKPSAPKSTEPKNSKCRMSRCNFSCASGDSKALKNHYTLKHFKAHFTEPQNGKSPRIPLQIDQKKGLKCEMCTKSGGGKASYVNGSREEVVLHYAVHHDKLLNAMKKRATEREVIMAIGDLYGKENENKD
jgi:hypothetical protein